MPEYTCQGPLTDKMCTYLTGQVSVLGTTQQIWACMVLSPKGDVIPVCHASASGTKEKPALTIPPHSTGQCYKSVKTSLFLQLSFHTKAIEMQILTSLQLNT